MGAEVITGTTSKRADRYAIEVLGIPSLTLMENASSKVSEHIVNNFPSSSVLVLAGTGNNGADGVCTARILHNDTRFEGQISVIISGNMEHASWEFLHQLSEYRRYGGTYSFYKENDPLPYAGVLVDAVFGIGLLTPLRENKASLLNKADSMHYSCVIAVDIPSGINSDTGEIMGAGIHADTTITFGRCKTGLVNGEGKELAGRIITEDIGIPDEAYDNVLS